MLPAPPARGRSGTSAGSRRCLGNDPIEPFMAVEATGPPAQIYGCDQGCGAARAANCQRSPGLDRRAGHATLAPPPIVEEPVGCA
jgi:hypothetical protein